MSEPLSTEIDAIRARHPEATHTAAAMLDAAVLHQRIAELEARHAKALACLKLIEESGHTWCAEQAREVLKQLKGESKCQ